ncbi:MAG: peptide ABC transporter substrate-binding protein [Anaerolineae bacterium]|nr:peptide ABC transporter substrate-binding protein [Anaerolineae bacterium]MDW8098602.1 peptide ABC transporter substrate-binding protein [Anaerolineae bacterium]
MAHRRLPLRWGGVFIGIAGVVALAIACSFLSPSEPVNPMLPSVQFPTWTPTRPASAQIGDSARRDLVIGLTLPEETLDPLRLPPDDLAARFVVDALFDRLMPPDPNDGRMTPGVVETWTVAADSQTITLTVRSGMTWHDGTPVTAKDVAFTIHAAISLTVNSPYFVQLAHVLSAQAISDSTVVVHLDEPSCPDLTRLGDLPLIPAHRWGGDARARATFERSPLGSGPLRFGSWGAGEVVLWANEAYWRGAPQIAEWRLRVLSPSQLREAWEAGELDVALLPRELALNPPPGWPIQWEPGLEYVGVFLNQKRLRLADTRLRQALALALDRSQLNQLALDGRGLPLGAPWLPALWAIAPAPTPPAFNRERAAALLDAAGWRDTDGDGWREHHGEPLLVRVKANGENPVRRDLAMLVAAAYRAVGVPAEVEILPYLSLADALFRRDFDVAIFGWPINLDPDQSWYWRSDQAQPRRGFNLTGWQDAQADALWQAGRSASACATAARQAVYQQLAAYLADQRPVDFLFALPIGVAIRPGLNGIALSPFAGVGPSLMGWHW